MFKDPELERVALKSLMEHQYVNILTFDETLITSPPYRSLIVQLKDLYKEHKVAADIDTLTWFLNSKRVKPESISDSIATMQEILSQEAQPKSNHDFYMGELARLKTRRNIFDLISECKKDLEDGKSAEIIHKMSKRVLFMDQERIDKDTDRNFVYTDAKARWQKYKETEAKGSSLEGISTGMRFLDNVTGGIEPSYIFCFCGKSGIGKTRILLNIGYNIAKRGIPVLFLSYEMKRKDLVRCYDSRDSLLKFTEIKEGSLSPQGKKKLHDSLVSQTKRKDPFYLVDLVPGTSVSIAEEVERFYETYKQMPAVVIADHAGLLRPTTKWGITSERYNLLFEELHVLAKRYNIALFTAVHESSSATSKKPSKDGKEEDERIGAQYVAWSYHIVNHCELLIQMKVNEKDTVKKQIRLAVIKSRYTPSHVIDSVFCYLEYNYIGNYEVALGEDGVGKTLDTRVIEKTEGDRS